MEFVIVLVFLVINIMVIVKFLSLCGNVKKIEKMLREWKMSEKQEYKTEYITHHSDKAEEEKSTKPSPFLIALSVVCVLVVIALAIVALFLL